jgi:hypothetical protein
MLAAGPSAWVWTCAGGGREVDHGGGEHEQVAGDGGDEGDPGLHACAGPFAGGWSGRPLRADAASVCPPGVMRPCAAVPAIADQGGYTRGQAVRRLGAHAGRTVTARQASGHEGTAGARMDAVRPGRGTPVSQEGWPAEGKFREWLAFCDQVHQDNGLPSRRTLAEALGLTSGTRVNDLLRGRALPADEKQARTLLSALGAVGTEVRHGLRLYRAARAERDQAARDVGLPGWWLRSGYIGIVGDIAPLQLLGRQEELDELASWCVGGDEAYTWWQAGPRAGKSALMAWLALHPPPGTWVISFFITARLASQADSAAFTSALLDQLAAVTGEQAPRVTSATLRDGLCRQLLAESAARAARAGRRLVLVVDGLDEDCGSLPGSGLASIAACLPGRPPDGLQVIVASRPDPPLPADVGPDHPLRHCRVRRLDVSPHAAQVTQLAQRELDEVLATDKARHEGLGYQVLGLVTASGGGLGDRDLQQLTGRPAFEVDRLLRGVFGRTIAGRADPNATTRALLFTHETLREQAADRLGPEVLAGFGERLHVWADVYQYRGWPEDTPAYLLHGYPRMLASTGNLARLVTLATDPARHDRMLDVTGGDAATLTEIAAAHALIATSPSPDLLSALRLAWHRDQLIARNAAIPVQLPAVWAALGHPVRAEALARSKTYPESQVMALAGVAGAVAAAGDHDHARALAAGAEQVARSITDPGGQAEALAGVAGAVAAAGDHDRARALAASAEQVARSITDPNWETGILAEGLAAAGEQESAEEFADSIEYVDEQARTLVSLARVAAAAGDQDGARALAASAEEAARSVLVRGQLAEILAVVAGAVAAAGDSDRARALAASAEQVARSITDLSEQAEQGARSITDPDRQAWVLASLASVAEPSRARSCIAGALAAGQWTHPLPAVARIDPAALSAFADERMASVRPPESDNGPLSGTSDEAYAKRPDALIRWCRDSGTLRPQNGGGGTTLAGILGTVAVAEAAGRSRPSQRVAGTMRLTSLAARPAPLAGAPQLTTAHNEQICAPAGRASAGRRRDRNRQGGCPTGPADAVTLRHQPFVARSARVAAVIWAAR